MIKKLILSIFLFQATIIVAQQSTSSPYSLYGLGLEKFKGSIANKGLGGLSGYANILEPNLQNPATYADIQLTSFSAGLTYTDTTIESTEGTGGGKATTFDYLTLAIPAGKFGFGLGIVPYRSVGYNTEGSAVDSNGDTFNQSFLGQGNLNRVYIGAGAQIFKGFKLGAEFQYNFGRLEEQVTVFPATTFASRFIFQSDISGVSYRLSGIYDLEVEESLSVRGFFIYDTSARISASNSEERAVVSSFGDLDFSQDEEVLDTTDRALQLPKKLTLGLGVTKLRQWHLGTEAYIGHNGGYKDRTKDRPGIGFTDAYGAKMGGFIIPKFNSLTSYLSRITYRAGMRYDNLGLQIDGTSINEFGISFGLGLPLPRDYSNLDIAFELGSRGTITDTTIREDFFSVSFGLVIGQKWFRKRKFD